MDFFFFLSIKQHQRSKESKEMPLRNLTIPSYLSLGHTDTASFTAYFKKKNNKKNEVLLIVPHFRLFFYSPLC